MTILKSSLEEAREDRAQPTEQPHEIFSLSGRSAALDPRVNAIRADLADVALAGILFAPRYARPLIRRCHAPAAWVNAAAKDDAQPISQLLAGESFAILDLSGDWAWGYCLHDHYVGYVRAEALADAPAPTHRVIRATALVHAAPTETAPSVAQLSLGAGVVVDGHGAENGDALWHAVNGGFVLAGAIAPVAPQAADAIALTEELIGLPYRPGGRGADGIDCSGLVQLTQGMAGHALPRDSDMQQLAVPALPSGAAPMRGDLVFVPGHVGMLVDASHVIHASLSAMAVVVEPLTTLAARATATHSHAVIAFGRIS